MQALIRRIRDFLYVEALFQSDWATAATAQGSDCFDVEDGAMDMIFFWLKRLDAMSRSLCMQVKVEKSNQSSNNWKAGQQ